MRIELMNWSGHTNIGDDEMARILMKYFPEAINVCESPSDIADAYILGGGTLVTPSNNFLDRTDPKRTYGISIGVSDNWQGQYIEFLRQMPVIYCRDNFSYERLKGFGCNAKLSVDLLCALEPKSKKKRKGIWANLMRSGSGRNVNGQIDELINRKDIHFFAVCSLEDKDTKSDSSLYLCGQMLLDRLSSVATVYATRLHANVIAWMAECELKPIVYDSKIEHFLERVKGLTPKQVNLHIKKDLKELKRLIYGKN